MLGRLRMSIDDTIEAYKTFSPVIFKKKWWAGTKFSKFAGAQAKWYWFEADNVKNAVQDLLQKRGLDAELKAMCGRRRKWWSFMPHVSVFSWLFYHTIKMPKASLYKHFPMYMCI